MTKTDASRWAPTDGRLHLPRLSTLFATVLTLVTASGFAEQDVRDEPQTSSANAEQQPHQGPLRVERIESGFVITPEVKFTEMDSESIGLVGAYGGWLMDRRLLLGFGGYFQTNPEDDRKMSYGGVVAEWFTAGKDKPVNFSVRTLVGAGTATLRSEFAFDGRRGEPFEDFFRGFPFDRRGRSFFDGSGERPFRFVERRLFFVVEPQVDLIFNLSRRARLGLGAGYRAVAADRGFGSRLSGASASVSLQIALFD